MDFEDKWSKNLNFKLEKKYFVIGTGQISTWGHSSQLIEKELWVLSLYEHVAFTNFSIPAASVAFAAPLKDDDDDVRHVVNPCIPKLCILRIDNINLQN